MTWSGLAPEPARPLAPVVEAPVTAHPAPDLAALPEPAPRRPAVATPVPVPFPPPTLPPAAPVALTPAPLDGSPHVAVTRWLVEPGDTVVPGDGLAETVTAAGTSALVVAPFTGRVHAIDLAQGRRYQAGRPLLRILPAPPRVFTVPATPLTPQQHQVWALVAGWSGREAYPARLVHGLTAMSGAGLRRLARRGEALPVHVFAFPGGTLRGGPGADAPVADGVPPFLLVLSDDPPELGQDPFLHVVTPDVAPTVALWPAPARADGAQTWTLSILWDPPGPTADSLSVGLAYPCDDTEVGDAVADVLGVPRPARATSSGGGRTVPGPQPAGNPLVTLPPMPGPAADVGPPFPAAAEPDLPPPPLPGTRRIDLVEATSEPGGGVPGQRTTDGPLEALTRTAQAPDTAHAWHARLVATPHPDWAALRLLRLRPGMRTVESARGKALLEEDGVCEVVAALLDVRSLPAAGILHPPLSRLRMLHQRLLPVPPGVPVDAAWSRLLDAPAVHDRFADPATRLPSGFSIAGVRDAADGDGPATLAVVTATAPAYRTAVVGHADTLARRLVQPGRPLGEVPPTWVAPPGWTAVEELQLTTPTAAVTVRLTPLWPGAAQEDWEAHEFARAPFLRGLRPLGLRDVAVPGLIAPARLHRFDWQPSGASRTLTTACFGIAAGEPDGVPFGFSMVSEVPLAAEDGTLQPDEVLARLRVLRTATDDR